MAEWGQQAGPVDTAGGKRPAAGLGGQWRRAVQRVRGWLAQDAVQEWLALVRLQATLAAALVAAGLLLRAVPLSALDPARAGMRWAFTQDLPVSDLWGRANAWAAARGGWVAAVSGTLAALRQRLVAWLPPAGIGEWLGAGLPGPGGAGVGLAGTGSGVGGAPAAAGGTATAGGGSGTGAGSAGSPGGAGAPGPPTAGTAPGQAPGPAGSVPPGGAGSGAAGGGAAVAPPSQVITLRRSDDPAAQEPRPVRPVPGKVISAFGWRDGAGGQEELHTGLDLAASVGTPVRALRAGTVKAIGSGPHGRYVEVDHGGGLTSRYAPLAAVAVREGQAVQAGDVLGQLGPPPGSEPGEPHLHLEVRQDGREVDPAPFLDRGGV